MKCISVAIRGSAPVFRDNRGEKLADPVHEPGETRRRIAAPRRAESDRRRDAHVYVAFYR